MRTFTRLSLIAGAAIFAQMAHAAISYNIIEADIAFNTGEVSALDVAMNGHELDFSAGDIAALIGDGAWTANGRNAAVVSIVYTATSDELINGVNLIFSGWAVGKAGIGYTEYIEEWDADSQMAGDALGQVSGAQWGAGMGGSDSPFTVADFISFENGVYSYKVKKTFTLANLDQDPASSFASLGLVEQNAVPEPATMGALAVGALGLLARRRRK